MEALLTILIPVLIQVESHGNDKAVGDDGKALGALQIHAAYWQDGTESLKVDWPYSDAHNREKAIRVARAYLTRYGRHYERTTGNQISLEVLARIHNGGPTGWNRKYKQRYANTTKYWEKVQIELKKQERVDR